MVRQGMWDAPVVTWEDRHVKAVPKTRSNEGFDANWKETNQIRKIESKKADRHESIKNDIKIYMPENLMIYMSEKLMC